MEKLNLKYTSYLLVASVWYTLMFFYTASVIYKIIVALAYVIWLLVYFLYYMPIDKKYQQILKSIH